MITRALTEVFLRYLLGLIMVAYGLIKIFKIQFELPPSVYDLPLKELEGVTLTWAFLEFSSWFSIILGFLEFVPGVMLLFTRTKLIGAILLLPTLLAVVLINNAYGFLLHMRIFSGCLLLINITIICFSYKKLSHIIVKLFEHHPKRRIVELMVNTFLVGVITIVIIYFLK
ncbi:MAG: hypothetical protein AAGI07_01070 [Bacteroidota bacterium]